MRIFPFPITAAAILSACQPVEIAPQTSAAAQPSSEMASRDNDGVPLLVNATCRSCHAVTMDALSTLPQAPGFADIANTPDLTRETLIAFLSNAHNYPDQMDVDLDDDDIVLIAEYMLTLQSEGYSQPPS